MIILIAEKELEVQAPIQFSGGERHVQMPPEIADADNVAVFARIYNSNDLMDVVLTLDAIGRMSECSIQLSIPYFPYGRQDRVCAPGQAFSLQVVVHMLTACQALHGNDLSISTVDMHSPVPIIASLPQWMAIDIDSKLNDWIQKTSPVLVCPDKGALVKCQDLMDRTVLFDRMVVGDKVRNPSTGWIESYTLEGDVEGERCLIADDICDGGATFNMLAKELKKRGAKEVVLFVTHGIWSKGLDVMRENIDDFYTTDTLEQSLLHDDNVIKLFTR